MGIVNERAERRALTATQLMVGTELVEELGQGCHCSEAIRSTVIYHSYFGEGRSVYGMAGRRNLQGRSWWGSVARCCHYPNPGLSLGEHRERCEPVLILREIDTGMGRGTSSWACTDTTRVEVHHVRDVHQPRRATYSGFRNGFPSASAPRCTSRSKSNADCPSTVTVNRKLSRSIPKEGEKVWSSSALTQPESRTYGETNREAEK